MGTDLDPDVVDRLFAEAFSTIERAEPPPAPSWDEIAYWSERIKACRPEWDRLAVAPDVLDRLRDVSGPTPPWRPAVPLGLPVFVDDRLEPGSWELRDGDRVVRRSGEGAS